MATNVLVPGRARKFLAKPRSFRWLTRIGVIAVALLLIGAGAAAVHVTGLPGGGGERLSPGGASRPGPADSLAALVPGEADTLRVPADVVRKLGIRTAEVKRATQPRPLTLPGSLALDANRLARIHARFAGEVVEIGRLPDGDANLSSSGPSVWRQVQLGDKVHKNQLLAVVWSKELGEKKSELVDGLSQLRLDRVRLEKLEEGYRRQAIPEASVRQARRDVEAALNAVARAERTLRVWRLSDAEIEAVKAEAERIRQRQGTRDRDKEKDWARVEVRAPFAGTVLERNVALGDLVDTATDLFKVADLSRLSVWAHVYENQLPALLRLPTPIPWTIHLKADPSAPPVLGRIDMIGSIIDPNQHTALVRGHVENPGERLRAGQFITATIDLPPSPGEIAIPIAALIEDGQESVVMVQPSATEFRYALRRVQVARRGQEVAYIHGPLPAREGRSGFQPPRPGDLVVTSGAIALKAALEDLKALAR